MPPFRNLIYARRTTASVTPLVRIIVLYLFSGPGRGAGQRATRVCHVQGIKPIYSRPSGVPDQAGDFVGFISFLHSTTTSCKLCLKQTLASQTRAPNNVAIQATEGQRSGAARLLCTTERLLAGRTVQTGF